MTESASLPALHHGDALSVLSSLPDAVADALVTDPPYSSGGLLTASRQQPPEAKYPNGPRGDLHPSFHGDTRDQRSHLLWMSMWLQEARRAPRTRGISGTSASTSSGAAWGRWTARPGWAGRFPAACACPLSPAASHKKTGPRPVS